MHDPDSVDEKGTDIPLLRFDRVRKRLNLQGWQLVDKLNRAFVGEDWSGYVPPLHVVTADNIAFDGGPTNVFDPGNGYRDAYKKIWGK